jgi:hypothetical protein
MPGPLLIAIFTCLGLTVLMPLAMGIVMFLLPGGRKGNMRTERAIAHDGMSVEQAKSLYAQRLAYDNFVITNAANPARIEAARPRAPTTETFAHSDKGLNVEIDFAPDARGGVNVRIAMWMDDYILRDTGEGRLIDMTLDRLVNAELDREPPPVVPNTSLMASSSLASVLAAIVIIVALAVGVASPGARTAAVIVGAGLACVLSMLTALQALGEMHRRPAEVTGRGLVAATMIFGALGILAGAVALYLRFGQSVLKTLRALVP